MSEQAGDTCMDREQSNKGGIPLGGYLYGQKTARKRRKMIMKIQEAKKEIERGGEGDLVKDGYGR